MSEKSAREGLLLISRVFRDGAAIPKQYTCRGQSARPPLNIFNVPKTAKSLALIMHDPDGVSGDFTHWLLWNIPPDTEWLGTQQLPDGTVEGLNGALQNKYMGPCPPSGTGTHRYIFELYALDNMLELKPNGGRESLETAIKGHIIDETQLFGTFSAEG